MDNIGTGFRMVGDKLIVKLSMVPDTNRKVYAEDGKEVGKLVDIIGPVDYPFGVVAKTTKEDYQGKIIAVKKEEIKK